MFLNEYLKFEKNKKKEDIIKLYFIFLNICNIAQQFNYFESE